MTQYTRRQFLRMAAAGAVAGAALFAAAKGIDSLLKYAEKTEQTPTPAEPQTQMPMPTNAEIKEGIESLLAIGDKPTYDSGIDHRAEVLSLGSKIYQTLHEGRTLEQDNPTIYFLTNEEWTQKTSTPRSAHLKDAGGFTSWENTESKKYEFVLEMYIRGNRSPLETILSLAHESGIANVRRAWYPIFTREYNDWDSTRVESAGYLSEVAFLKKMEEAGLEATKYANTEKNRSYIKYFLENDIWKESQKDAHFDANGELKANYVEMFAGTTRAKWYGPSVFALDQNFKEEKKAIELRGRTTPEDNMRVIKELTKINPDDFPTYFKGLLNANTYSIVRDWTIQVATSPARLNGNNAYPYPSKFNPIDLLP